MPVDKDLIYLNGIDVETGEYLVKPFTLSQAAGCARGNPPPADKVTKFTDRMVKSYGLPDEVTATELAEAGWAIVFPKGTPSAVRDALKPLVEHRKRTAGTRCRVFDWDRESREEWLADPVRGVRGSEVEPDKLPYYILLVGGPDQISYQFQYELDVDYAVGRLSFDRPEDYAAYAEAVVRYEHPNTPPKNAREVVYWGTRHDGDGATELSADYLISVLHTEKMPDGALTGKKPIAEKQKFGARCFLGDTTGMEADKKALLKILQAGADRPALLFTASHGMGGWKKGSPEQRANQGALLCQDWSGFGKIKPAHYLTAAEIDPASRHDGMIAFVFACYAAGTPRYDDFLKNPVGGPIEIAPDPFVSGLSRRLLTGGALAVIGHVERAWGYSIQPPGVPAQLGSFRHMLGRLMAGEQVAHATRDFSQRYATASVSLLNKVNPSQPGAAKPTDESLARDWIERNDAQNYVILGDPAVALRADDLK